MSKHNKNREEARPFSHENASKTPPHEKDIITFTDSAGVQHQAYKLANGTLKDVETGAFLTPPSTPPFLDPAKAREAALSRHRRAREQAIRGLMKAARDKGLIVSNGEEAWGEVIRAMAKTALDGGSRQSVRAAQLAGKATGYMGEETKHVQIEQRSADLTVDADMVLLQMFNELYGGNQESTLREFAKFKADPGKWLEEREND